MCLNIFESNDIDFHFFDRNFAKNNILSYSKKQNKISEMDYIDNVPNNDYIIELDKKRFSDDSVSCNFYFNDYNFKRLISKRITLPKSQNILFYHKSNVYYTKQFDLYSCNIDNNEIKKIDFKNFKFQNIIFISDSKFIALGELKESKNFIEGFFLLDVSNGSVRLLKKISSSDYMCFLENSLKYTGEFTNSFTDDIISYTCDKNSNVYIFDKNGNFISKIETNDKVPLPKILTNSAGDSFYARGKTWNTNAAGFIKNGFLYVFSCRDEERNNLVVDKYSLNTNKYEQSYMIKCDGYSSRDITNLFVNDKQIILSFTSGYASLKFSR